MQRIYKGVAYQDVESVPVRQWNVQGTIYDKLFDAQHAAAKVLYNVTGVVVKRYKEGWTLYWWR